MKRQVKSFTTLLFVFAILVSACTGCDEQKDDAEEDIFQESEIEDSDSLQNLIPVTITLQGYVDREMNKKVMDEISRRTRFDLTRMNTCVGRRILRQLSNRAF